MSSSLKFIGFTVLAWATARTVITLLSPETRALWLETAAATPATPLPPIAPTMLPPIEPLDRPTAPAQLPPAYLAIPYPVPVLPPSAGTDPQGRSTPQFVYVEELAEHPRPGTLRLTPSPLEGVKLADASVPGSIPRPIASPIAVRTTDRLSVSSWAMVRNRRGPDSLAGGGMLGGSEAGARLLWRATPHLSVSARTSAPVNSRRGMEVAAGIRYQPSPAWPIAVTLERRHAIRDYGRDAFALFAEGGIYDRPMPWQFRADGYFQTGIVDFNNPDWFVDGQAALGRPIWRSLSGGIGLWGAAQPGLARLDVGPRLSVRVGNRMRAHVDYRLNVAGNAHPGSGAVLTIAGDF